MRPKRKLSVVVFALAGLFLTAGADALAVVGQPAIPVSTAGATVLAIVGRPATPVSAAGVARRTVRRGG